MKAQLKDVASPDKIFNLHAWVGDSVKVRKAYNFECNVNSLLKELQLKIA